MHLIDKDDAVAAIADFLDDFFQALFKFTTVFGSSHQGADIEGEQAFASQRFWNLARDQALCQPFDNSCLTNTGLADERRIILIAAGEESG